MPSLLVVCSWSLPFAIRMPFILVTFSSIVKRAEWHEKAHKNY
jgi:hypothetical protein